MLQENTFYVRNDAVVQFKGLNLKLKNNDYFTFERWDGVSDKLEEINVPQQFLGNIQQATEEQIAAHTSALRSKLCQSEAKKFFSKLKDEPKAKYMATKDGLDFVLLLRKFEHTLYAKVRYPDKFFTKYRYATGLNLDFSCPQLLHSQQKSKWGDEMIMHFDLQDFEPSFPQDAHPRLKEGDESKGILNDNEYIWSLICDHGFRFQGGRIQ